MASRQSSGGSGLNSSAASAAARRRSVVSAEVGVTEDFLDELKHRMSIRHYETGDVIVKAGDIGDEMFFIGSGAVNIVVNEAEKKVIQIKTGFFGEVALYMTDSKRVATVLAAVDSDIMILTRRVIADVLSRYPKVKGEFEAEARRRGAATRGGTSGTVEAVGSDWMHKLADLVVGYDPTVQVAIRVRPSQIADSQRTIFKIGANHVEAYDPAWSEREAKEKKRAFHFDFMYDEAATTERIADEVGVHVNDAIFDGFHACVLAYGQTGTGKTHTMEGLTLMMTRELFTRIGKIHATNPSVRFDVKVSHLEVYCEVLRDLLARGNPDPPELLIRGSVKTNIYVDNLQKKATANYDELVYFFNAGMAFRTMSKTATNEQSSPAHTIFTVYVTKSVTYEDGFQEAITTKMVFADLAGTQREHQKRTGLDAIRHENDGTEEQAEHERRNINVALQTLSVVIHKLASDVEPPYRQSKLSLLLAQSLGGNAKTYFMATLGQDNLKLSLRTLKDAEFAMRIQNKAVRARLSGRKKLNSDFLNMDDGASLSFEASWGLVREANALMDEIGAPVVFSVQPHAELSTRYPFGIRLTNLDSTLSALHDPDEFELLLEQEKMWVQRYFDRASGGFHPGTDRSLEPFAVAPPLHLIDQLRIPLAGLAFDGAVEGVFSNRLHAGPRAPGQYGADVSFRAAVDMAEARRVLTAAGGPSASMAKRGSLAPASEAADRRRRQSVDVMASDVSGRSAARLGASLSGKTVLAEYSGLALPLNVAIGAVTDFRSEYSHEVHVVYDVDGSGGQSEPLLYRGEFESGASLAHAAVHEITVTDSLLSGFLPAAAASKDLDPVPPPEAHVEVWGRRDAALYSPKVLRARLRLAESRVAEIEAAIVAVKQATEREAAPMRVKREAYGRMLELYSALQETGAVLAETEQFDA